MNSQINNRDSNSLQNTQVLSDSVTPNPVDHQEKNLTQSNNNSEISQPEIPINNKSISKIIKKLIIAMLLIPILIIILLFVIAAPGARKFSSCLDQLNESIEGNMQTARIERWDEEKVCIDSKVLVEEFKACHLEADEVSPILYKLVVFVSKIFYPNIVTLEQIISIHNTDCKGFPELLVTYP